MKTVKWTIHTGFAGAKHEGEFELSDDMTEKDIEDELQHVLNEYCEISYEIEE